MDIFQPLKSGVSISADYKPINKYYHACVFSIHLINIIQLIYYQNKMVRNCLSVASHNMV